MNAIEALSIAKEKGYPTLCRPVHLKGSGKAIEYQSEEYFSGFFWVNESGIISNAALDLNIFEEWEVIEYDVIDKENNNG